ncbi:hypothetical protein AAE478_002906 [Parahypoxylon ruwenzoriense]
MALVPFSEAIKAEVLDSNTYQINLNEAFCIGAVPNDGYVASCMLAAGSAHLTSRGHPYMLTAYFEYHGQTTPGTAIVTIEDMKLSQRLSALHLTLWQGGLLSQAPWTTPSVSRRVVLAFTTYTNIINPTDMLMPTRYEAALAAELPPLPDFDMLKTKQADSSWELSKLPKASASWPSLRNWYFYLPRNEPPTRPGVVDMWMHMASGERITQSTLAYLVDSFPCNLHTFLAPPETRKLTEEPQNPALEIRSKEAGREDQCSGLLFRTVVMNSETKMILPNEGVEWLAVRLMSKQIKDEWFDIDILVRTVNGEMVALSHHVAMIVSIET